MCWVYCVDRRCCHHLFVRIRVTSHTIQGIYPRPKILAGQQDKEMTSSSRGVLKTISENTGTPGVVVDKMHIHADTPAEVVNIMHENAGTPVLFADKMHNDATLDHEDTTVKGQEDKLKEGIASLKIFCSSDTQKGLVVKKEELRPPYNDIEAHLATLIEVQERCKEVDIKNIFLLEEKHEILSRKIEKLEKSLDTRQQVLNVSMRILVCLRLCMPFVNC
jgi:hypothetical protein